MNSSLEFSALLAICFFPILAVIEEIFGGSVSHVIVVRMGLNHQAAADVDALISGGKEARESLTVLSAVVLVLFALGVAGSLQGWYQEIYDRPPLYGPWKGLASRAVWLIVFFGWITVQVQIGQHVGPFGYHVAVFLAEFAVSVIFWAFSVYLLLLGGVGWRELIPTGLATAFCLTGLSVFSALLFSSSVISGEKEYGPIGVVTVLLSYLIGFGVCIHLGAVFGRMWNERHAPEPASTPSPVAETATTDKR
jgi:membrane protein